MSEDPAVDLDAFLDALRREERPFAAAAEVARRVGCTQAEADAALSALADAGNVGRVDVSDDPVVFYPQEWSRLADGERIVVFPNRREVVAHRPTQYTRARLSQFARLTDTTGHRGYRYVIGPEDVWNAPFEDLADLLVAVRSVLPRRDEGLEAWIEDQWERTRLFTLRTHEDGYTVLQAETPELMGNVAEQHLGEAELHARIDDTTAWVREGEEAAIKRALYEAGYPVRDRRDLDSGDPLDLGLTTELRPYQRDWVERFIDRKAGVLVGPPGSGKTVAALGVLAAVGGETLVLVPGRELARQWRTALLDHTTLTDEEVGEYHGGRKEIRPVTVATYHVAGMDRHRRLFDDREWGLIVFDEAHHVPSPVHRRAADLQSRHRLGLSVDGDTILPVRSDAGVEMRRIESLASDYLGDDIGVSSVTGLETIGVTDDGTVEWTPLTAVMRHEHDGPLYRVRARNGREVTVTADHSLVVFDGQTLTVTSKLPSELGGDDYVLQPDTSPTSTDESDAVDVMALLDEGYVLVDDDAPVAVFDPLYEREIADNKSRYNWKTRRNLPLWVAREIGLDRDHIVGVYRHGRHSYIPPEVPIEAFARLAGLFVADGVLDEHRVEFYPTDSENQSEVDEFLDLIHAVCPEADVSIQENGPNCATLRVSGVLRDVFETIGLTNGAREKHVPSVVLSNPHAYQPFVEGLVLGDGHRAERGRGREMVTVSTSSNRLAQGLNLMLAHLGHVGGVYRRNADVGVREETHDTVTNNLVRFNPKNRNDGGRLSLTPFTEPLQAAYENIERYSSGETDGGTIDSGLGHRSRLNDQELSTVVDRSQIDANWLVDCDVAMLAVDSVTEVDGSEYVYDVSTEHENFLGNHLFCHNSATPIREDDKETEIFTLVGPPIGTDGDALFDAGYVAEPEVELRFVPWSDDDEQNAWANADGHERRQLSATNPEKVTEVARLLETHADEQSLVFVDYIAQGEQMAESLDLPFLSGETPHYERERLLGAFRDGRLDALVVSRVGDEGIDLPNAEVAVVASGLGGSRRQGAQRAGRTMRPGGEALVYILATQGTEEEAFARKRTRHLAGKGVRVRETRV